MLGFNIGKFFAWLGSIVFGVVVVFVVATGTAGLAPLALAGLAFCAVGVLGDMADNDNDDDDDDEDKGNFRIPPWLDGDPTLGAETGGEFADFVGQILSVMRTIVGHVSTVGSWERVQTTGVKPMQVAPMVNGNHVQSEMWLMNG